MNKKSVHGNQKQEEEEETYPHIHKTRQLLIPGEKRLLFRMHERKSNQFTISLSSEYNPNKINTKDLSNKKDEKTILGKIRFGKGICMW